MILRIAYQDSDGNELNPYWDELRRKNHGASLEGVKQFIKENESGIRRRRKPFRRWQWAMAALLPLLVLLACTKTETTVPVGFAVSFTVPKNKKEVVQSVPLLSGGALAVASTTEKGEMLLAYTFFVPAEKANAETLTRELQVITGLRRLSVVPLTTQVKESFLSQLSYRVFRTHISATGLSNEALKQTIESQLKSKGIHVTVRIIQKGTQRSIELVPAEDTTDYSIDLTIDDGLNKTAIQEKRVMLADPPGDDFASMTDAEIKNYIRKKHGALLRDDEIHINRTSNEIVVTVKQGDETENSFRFKLKK